MSATSATEPLAAGAGARAAADGRGPRPAAQLALRAARGEDRLAPRADPLPERPDADRHLAGAAAALPLRPRLRPPAALRRQHPRGRPEDLHLPRRPLHLGDVHRHVLGRLDRLGPRVRLPPRDDGGADPAQLDRRRQGPRRRHRRLAAGADPAGARLGGPRPLQRRRWSSASSPCSCCSPSASPPSG